MTLPALLPEVSDTPPMVRRRRWCGRPRPAELPEGSWPPVISRLLALRGATSASSVAHFIDPPTTAPDPSVLPDFDVAIERMARAAHERECIAVFGDFDVDGVTSVAQLCEALTELGATALPYIPDRFSEGYGLNIEAIERLRASGATLLVTADCGTSSIEEVARARAIGMDVMVLDHHTVPPRLPDANALVNPKREDARPGPLLELATAGLAYHVAAALHAACGREFDASAYLDLAALGTVCDMAPLIDENRRLVRTGLPALARSSRPGLRVLMDVASVRADRVSADDIGYRLGPRLNAAGRIAHAKIALELLMTRDEERARDLAQQVDALNRERQDRTAQAVAQATEMMGDGEPPALIMIGDAAFSSGIVGLIASKLVSLYARPAVVYELGKTTSRASCRSIEEFHITDALRTRPDLFVRFGGHRAAAGFTVENRRIDEVREMLTRQAERALADVELVPVLDIDCNLPLRQLRGDEIRWLSRLGPFGIGNPQPLFLARGVTVVEARYVGNGDQHIKMKLRDGALTYAAIGFDLGECAVREGDVVDIVYGISSGRDGVVEVDVQDVRPAESLAP